jgi:pSer/pThr/pTyr-binding forkhead associated (FHA) protein
MQASLLVLVGKQKGRKIPLPGTLFIIGRDPLCHLRPHSNMVSRRHCGIACWGERVLIRDLKSANGTYLNHTRITRQVEAQNGDLLEVGDLSFSFQIARNANEPMQELRKDVVLWLMGESDDSEVLNPDAATATHGASLTESQAQAESEIHQRAGRKTKARGSKNLSAGKYLKDYLDS